MTHRDVWTLGLAVLLPALLLSHAGCGGESVLHGEDSGGGAGIGFPSRAGSTGNTGGTSTSPPARVLDFSTVNCDPSLLKRTGSSGVAAVDFLNTSCAKSFCHGKSFVVGLDLNPNTGFAERTLDVAASHGGISCPDDITKECIPAGCPPAGTVKLIDSADPTASWILTKAHGGQGDCGDRDPVGASLTSQEDACLIAIVNATAALK